MGTNRHKVALLEARVRRAVEAKDEREAKRVIAIWNARRAVAREFR
jgi:hypothetical protein